MKPYWILAVPILLWGCGEEEKTNNQYYEGPVAISTNVLIQYSEKALSRIKGRAPKRLIFKNNDKEFPDSIYIELYDEQGVKTTEITGDYCYEDYSERTYRAEGNVVVTNLEKGQTLETPRLYWDQRKALIYSDTNIKVITPTETLYGIGMEAKQDFSQYKILRPTGKMWQTFDGQ
jgi:LPS export ABC transporter protein LptC